MIPGGSVVSRPGEAVALAASVGGARQHKRPLVRTQLEQSLVSRARIFQSDNVVDLGMSRGARRKARLFDPVHRICRHRFTRPVKDRRLIHVVPEARNARRDKILVETAPPFARLRASEIGEDSGARPDRSYKLASIWILHKVIAGVT